jgi:branched-chain amino acid transport system substrate-binding protein
MKKLRYFGIFIVILLFLSVLVSARASAAPSSSTPVKIGALLPFTGISSVNMEGMKAALELKYGEVGGQVAGRKIQLILEDDGSNPTVAVDKARKLVESDKVDVVFGPLTSMDAVASYLTKSKTPLIHYMHNTKKVLQMGGGNVFIQFGTLEGLGYYMGDYIAKTLGYKSITVLHADFVAGEDFAGGTIKGFEAAGGTTVQRQRTPPPALDYSANIAGIKKADAVVIWFTPQVAQRFLVQYYASGLKMPIVVPACHVVSVATMKEIGDNCLGMIGDAVWSWMIDTEINKKYIEAFKTKTGKYPETEHTSAYIAMSIFLEAVKLAKGDTSHDAIIKALHKVKLNTPAGTFSYNADGVGIGNFYIQKINKIDGQYGWQPIKTYNQILLDVPSK